MYHYSIAHSGGKILFQFQLRGMYMRVNFFSDLTSITVKPLLPDSRTLWLFYGSRRQQFKDHVVELRSVSQQQRQLQTKLIRINQKEKQEHLFCSSIGQLYKTFFQSFIVHIPKTTTL